MREISAFVFLHFLDNSPGSGEASPTNFGHKFLCSTANLNLLSEHDRAGEAKSALCFFLLTSEKMVLL